MSGKQVISVLSTLEMEKVRAQLEWYLQSCFNQTERAYLATRHYRTTIGWLALKKAVVELAGKYLDTPLDDIDITLRCCPDGKPVVAEVTGLPELAGQLVVSISHSRAMAHGLAAMEQDGNG